MRSLLVMASLLVLAAAAGCLGSDEEQLSESNVTPTTREPGPSIAEGGNASAGQDASNATDKGEAIEPVRFGERVQVADGAYYEPSVEIGPEGTVFVTAAVGAYNPEERPRYASGFWYSTDGQSFEPIPSPGQAHRVPVGVEGTIAIDDSQRLYFVDMQLTPRTDNPISRWTLDGEEPSWEWTRPLQGTLAPLEDRPWLAAHGDGIVYSLTNVQETSTPLDEADQNPRPGEVWIHTSTDAGLTFGTGHSFPGSVWCSPAPSKATVGTVHVACLTGSRGDPTMAVDLYTSTDTGQSWQAQRLSANKSASPEEVGYPAAATDGEGTVYTAWADDDVRDEEPGRLRVARPNGTGTDIQTLVPFEGAVENPWLSATGDGRVALTFHGSPDVTAEESSPWYPYLLLTDDATTASPLWQLVRLTESPVGEGEIPPQDFFQNAFGPDGRVGVVYHEGADADRTVYYVQQVEGPNLQASTTG